MALWTAPTGRIVAFEPNPVARDVLATNATLNGLQERIIIEPMAVSNNAGTGELFHGTETSGLSRLSLPNTATSRGRPLTVKIVTLDAYCSTRQIVPQWVLIDAEGFEVEVLDGAIGLLRNPRVAFVVEIHPTLWADRSRGAALKRLLRNCGRTAVPLTGQQDAFSDYGTIAVS